MRLENAYMSIRMEQTWQIIDGWLTDHAPAILETLQPGAAPEALEKLERLVGIALPEDLKASLLIHDGQGAITVAAGDSRGLMEGWELLSTDAIADAWQFLDELRQGGDFDDNGEVTTEGALVPEWWSPTWLPVAHNGTSDYHCSDVAPPAGGGRGQVLTFWHDWENRAVEAPSYGDWLETFAHDLRDGHFQMVEGGIERILEA